MQVDVFEKALYVAAPLFEAVGIAASSIRFVCVAATLITIQDETIDVIEDKVERFLGHRRLPEASTAALMLEKPPKDVETDDLLAGVFGMNFDGIRITKVRYGYYIVLALMIALIAGQTVFFYRRGWFR